jgi:hypothetical protein
MPIRCRIAEVKIVAVRRPGRDTPAPGVTFVVTRANLHAGAGEQRDRGAAVIVAELVLRRDFRHWRIGLCWQRRLTGRQEVTTGMTNPDLKCPTKTKSSNWAKAAIKISARQLAPADWSFKRRSYPRCLVLSRFKLRDQPLPAPNSRARAIRPGRHDISVQRQQRREDCESVDEFTRKVER